MCISRMNFLLSLWNFNGNSKTSNSFWSSLSFSDCVNSAPQSSGVFVEGTICRDDNTVSEKYHRKKTRSASQRSLLIPIAPRFRQELPPLLESKFPKTFKIESVLRARPAFFDSWSFERLWKERRPVESVLNDRSDLPVRQRARRDKGQDDGQQLGWEV